MMQKNDNFPKKNVFMIYYPKINYQMISLEYWPSTGSRFFVNKKRKQTPLRDIDKKTQNE